VTRLAVFGYGSLVSAVSAAETLGRPVQRLVPARLVGWRRRWTLCRDNLTSEKTFALADGTVPPYVLGLNLERDSECAGANGVLIELSEDEAQRLDIREIRYDRVDVTADVRLPDANPGFDSVFTYTARSDRYAAEAPARAVVMATYLSAVEAAFAALGPAELGRFRETTDPLPVEAVEATLVRDEIPPGNPRRW
jgi:cation transport regulator ChaC